MTGDGKGERFWGGVLHEVGWALEGHGRALEGCPEGPGAGLEGGQKDFPSFPRRPSFAASSDFLHGARQDTVVPAGDGHNRALATREPKAQAHGLVFDNPKVTLICQLLFLGGKLL